MKVLKEHINILVIILQRGKSGEKLQSTILLLKITIALSNLITNLRILLI